MTDEKKANIIRWTALVFGAFLVFMFVNVIRPLFGGGVTDDFGFFFAVLMPMLPLTFPLTLLGSIYCIILVINPRKLPVFDSNENADEPPEDAK